ncbi:DUF2726 domain-containing protein (plasmid) [Xenorhabdus stockiae]|uniref:DUF2726 domain-containing protein n=1 Tax=Xenorhabdus stockiae TaxID=351614 RepID=UPI003CF535DB
MSFYTMLYSFLMIVFVFTVVVIFTINKVNLKKIRNGDSKLHITNGYLTNDIMTKTELYVFNDIRKNLKNNYHLLSQVRLADIVKVNINLHKTRTSEWHSLFNKISRRHCDFVVIDTNTGKTICAIELDDHTHRDDRRINRDMTINEIFKSAKIPLFRVDKDNFRKNLPTDIFNHESVCQKTTI